MHALALLLAASLVAKPDPGTPCGENCLAFGSDRAAFEAVLARKPRVLGVGEYHEVEGAPKVQSAIKRFTQKLLPTLKGRASALVVETWMVNGRCGEEEKQAVAEVKKVTKRPESTEDEVTTLLGKAHDQGVAPHILRLTCDEYKSMLDDKGEMDPEKTLVLVKRKVEEKAKETLEAQEEAKDERAVVLYGGALHNDLYPDPDLADFSFGPAMSQETSGHYVELDLLVPEYVADDKDLKAQPWFAPALALSAKGKVVLVNPRPDSYVLLFPRTKK